MLAMIYTMIQQQAGIIITLETDYCIQQCINIFGYNNFTKIRYKRNNCIIQKEK